MVHISLCKTSLAIVRNYTSKYEKKITSQIMEPPFLLQSPVDGGGGGGGLPSDSSDDMFVYLTRGAGVPL